MTDKSKPDADVKLDMSGLTCPAPMIGAKRVLDDLRPGQVLELVSDCPGTRDDLYIWARHTGNEIDHVDHLGGKKHAFYLRKGHRPEHKAHVTLDMRGAICPGPVLEAHRVLEGMKSDEVLRLVTTCTAARDEVKTWSKATHCTLLDEREIAPSEWEFYLRRG